MRELLHVQAARAQELQDLARIRFPFPVAPPRDFENEARVATLNVRFRTAHRAELPAFGVDLDQRADTGLEVVVEGDLLHLDRVVQVGALGHRKEAAADLRARDVEGDRVVTVADRGVDRGDLVRTFRRPLAAVAFELGEAFGIRFDRDDAAVAHRLVGEVGVLTE
jgi:hypothetical protein